MTLSEDYLILKAYHCPLTNITEINDGKSLSAFSLILCLRVISVDFNLDGGPSKIYTGFMFKDKRLTVR